jgi:two-component system sensor histidine kinase/response regulator
MLFDSGKVGTIVENLLSNALKHAQSSNSIFLSLERTPAAVLVEVRDQGPGIPASELPRLFDRFYRGKTSGEGHGLGLYIAASLARVMGGALSVQSELGVGSRFTLRLPFRA